MPPPSPVRIPGGHSRAVFSIHCNAASGVADPASQLHCAAEHPDVPAREDSQDQAADVGWNSIGVASDRAEGSGRAAGQADAPSRARSLHMITTSLDRSVRLWHMPCGADGVPFNAWKAAKV